MVRYAKRVIKGDQMKIDRLIGILSILLQKEMTTAPELADHFEVSRRTINRDIEDLCKAGMVSSADRGTYDNLYRYGLAGPCTHFYMPVFWYTGIYSAGKETEFATG